MSSLTAFDIIIRPVYFSAKAHVLSALGQYTFEVHPEATKIQIKAAVEELYRKQSIKVISVNVLTTKSKVKRQGTRRGRITGRTTPWRKAIVKVAPGQKIEGLYEGV